MNNSKDHIEQATGSLYHECFKELNLEQWHQQGKLLAAQLGLTKEEVAGKSCLDAGCGHGALCYQLHSLGAVKVVGVDLEPTPPHDADVPDSIEFIKHSLLELPFPDGMFDLVVTSGVLHHTVDPKAGAQELARVTKPGGKMVIGVYGKHGLFPYCLSIARLFTVKIKIIPYNAVNALTKIFRLDPIWRYQVLDYLYVPILRRFTPAQVIHEFFYANEFEYVRRVSAINKEMGDAFTKANTSYSYDHRRIKSKILFGYGFIVVEGIKK